MELIALYHHPLFLQPSLPSFHWFAWIHCLSSPPFLSSSSSSSSTHEIFFFPRVSLVCLLFCVLLLLTLKSVRRGELSSISVQLHFSSFLFSAGKLLCFQLNIFILSIFFLPSDNVMLYRNNADLWWIFDGITSQNERRTHSCAVSYLLQNHNINWYWVDYVWFHKGNLSLCMTSPVSQKAYFYYFCQPLRSCYLFRIHRRIQELSG